MELVAEGRMAEVYTYGDGQVVKLDRPEWSGVSAFESDVLIRLDQAGLPVARCHGVVTIDGRCGVVLDRVEGRPLSAHLLEAEGDAVAALAARFAALGSTINRTAMKGLPDLVSRLAGELGQSGLAPELAAELGELLLQIDDGQRGVCHFDFHPENVLVGPDRWVVIDWLTVASGPPAADLARTLVLWGHNDAPPVPAFMREVRRLGLAQRQVGVADCDAWIRVVAGARLAEGFEGADADRLRALAAGRIRLPA
ncbi:MAG TPA: aminoglycoside phosphotransferase family protein [Acidimicrobiales bacterium]